MQIIFKNHSYKYHFYIKINFSQAVSIISLLWLFFLLFLCHYGIKLCYLVFQAWAASGEASPGAKIPPHNIVFHVFMVLISNKYLTWTSKASYCFINENSFVLFLLNAHQYTSSTRGWESKISQERTQALYIWPAQYPLLLYIISFLGVQQSS